MAQTSVKSHLEFKKQLGEDLWALVQGLRTPLVDVTPLTTLPSPCRHRASFRLRFADGCLLKGRRFDSAAHAKRVADLSQFLDPGHFPRVLGMHGGALLIEWIDGHPLTPSEYSPELVRRCGALQGLLHSIPLRNGIKEMYVQAQDRRQDWQNKLEEDVHELVTRRALGREEAKQVFRLAIGHAPDRFSLGVVHRDFCAENMVLHAPGHIYVIDNETLHIDAYDYDLARTWYRWPLNSLYRKAYYEGYNQYRSAGDFTAHFHHWAVTVLVESAVFRLRIRTRGTSIPIRRLRALLRDVRSRTSLRFEGRKRISDAR